MKEKRAILYQKAAKDHQYYLVNIYMKKDLFKEKKMEKPRIKLWNFYQFTMMPNYENSIGFPKFTKGQLFKKVSSELELVIRPNLDQVIVN